MSLGTAIIYLVALLVAAFIVSGVVPRYLEVRRRLPRVEEFDRKYRAYLDGRERDYEGFYSDHGGSPPHGDESAKLRAWLTPRRAEMQRDAAKVRKGVVYVAPPPAIGGGNYMPHYMFRDLYDTQSFTEYAPANLRTDELVTIIHETRYQESAWRRDLFNPWAWLRLAFERLVGFPRYVLRLAGFSTEVTDSAAARAVSAAWSFLVGAAGIGGFVVALLK